MTYIVLYMFARAGNLQLRGSSRAGFLPQMLQLANRMRVIFREVEVLTIVLHAADKHMLYCLNVVDQGFLAAAKCDHS
jgi:hypothetical protein